MDRYEFEDVISDYIDHSLSVSKMQEFEAYIKANPEAAALVESVRKTMHEMRTLPKIKTSASFMGRLWARVDVEKARAAQPERVRKSGTFLGFTPLYAGLMAVLVVSFIFVGMELMPNGSPDLDIPSNYTESTSSSSAPAVRSKPMSPEMVAEVEEDSLNVDENDSEKQRNFKNRIQFVKDQ